MKLNNKNVDIQKWDAWNDLGGPNYPHEKVVQFCLRNYPSDKRASTRVLDLGCGTGANTWFLSREGFTVTGTDISSRAIAATKSRLDRSGLLAKLRVEGANAINDPDESFDLIICIGVIEAVGPTIAKEVFEGVYKALVSNGFAFFLFASSEDYRIGESTCYNLHGYSKEEVQNLLPEFRSVMLDRYMSTYENGTVTQCDWMLTCRK